jgi:hypothetical protein
MLMGTLFQPFIEQSPLSVLARLAIERTLRPQLLDDLFERTAERPYTRDLLFSSLLDLMSLVTCGSAKHVQAGCRRLQDDLPVTLKCVYEKLQRMETGVCAELVRSTSAACQSLIRELGGQLPDPLPGYRIKVLDGNCLAGTAKQLKPRRGHTAAALPGKTLVVLDPALMQMIAVVPCADAHTQERALIPQLYGQVERNDVWVADRNFCVIDWMAELDDRKAYFVIRRHKQVTVAAAAAWGEEVETATGWGSERPATVQRGGVWDLAVRVVRVRFKAPARDGEVEVEIRTNLPRSVGAVQVAEIYLGRWEVATALQELTVYLGCALNTLGYPQAALFGFCVALVAYNIQSVVKGALRRVHGAEKIEEELSGYYVAMEWAAVYAGMMIALPAEAWAGYGEMSSVAFAELLRALAKQVQLDRFKKQKRGPKKKPTPKVDDGVPHRSTARVLQESKAMKQ